MPNYLDTLLKEKLQSVELSGSQGTKPYRHPWAKFKLSVMDDCATQKMTNAVALSKYNFV